ncbi:AbiJ-NTD4 domain-containing protein [Bosea sp. (in: a-proteobacteria)]|uniref:AbiJ-NTD4 domain-containing protein n=1 Tax=Bosea sp. (in: a-proteobacteria) TaxID=1871050 RepID=UPI00263845BC|nr:hypothetical protein [Bosea sp. (in: a-proteobacteria)]MCO5089882.1 hypothetical protein [Bosea sp. (in: a-proteobacteria)]
MISPIDQHLGERLESVQRDAADAAAQAVQTVMRQQSAKGMLASGNTVLAAEGSVATIYQEAIDQAAEFAIELAGTALPAHQSLLASFGRTLATAVLERWKLGIDRLGISDTKLIDERAKAFEARLEDIRIKSVKDFGFGMVKGARKANLTPTSSTTMHNDDPVGQKGSYPVSTEQPFSKRFGFRPDEPPITVREDSPDELRFAVVQFADDLGLSPSNARMEVCGKLLKKPDANNWSEYPNIFDEVRYLVEDAPWFKVYDIAEGFYARLAARNPDAASSCKSRVNDLFVELGIGWQMRGGVIVARGSEAFNHALEAAADLAKSSRRPTATSEIHEALRDISRRPTADVTGAIHHAMNALECVARDVTGDPKKTIGQLATELNIPKPMDTAIEKLWGFASEHGRHIREGRTPRFEEAELVVTIAAGLCSYLIRANGKL